MSRRQIWGFGYFQASLNANFTDSASIETSTGKLYFAQVFNDYENINHSIRRIFKGWRPIINVSIVNLNKQTSYGLDTLQITKLLSIINTAKSQGQGIYIRPRLDNTVSLSQYTFYCELVSDVNVQDGDPTCAFQTLELEFRGINLLPTIPTSASSPQGGGWIREDGNQYIDQDGNYYTLLF